MKINYVYHKKKIVTAGIVTLFVASLLAGCGNNKNKETLLTVGSETVSAYQWNLETLVYLEEKGIPGDFAMDGVYQEGAGSSAMTYEQHYKDEIITRVAERKAILIQAKEQELTLSDEEQQTVSSQIEDFLANHDENALKRFGINQDMLREYFEEIALTDKFEDQVLADAIAKEEALQQENVTRYTTNNMLFCTVELASDGSIRTNDQGEVIPLSPQQREEQLSKAGEALERVKHGESFEELIQEYELQNTSGEIRGTKDTYPDEYQEVLGNMSVGDIYPDIIETEYGYYVMKVLEIGNSPEQEQLQDGVVKAIGVDELVKQRKEWLQAVEFNEENNVNHELLDKLDLLDVMICVKNAETESDSDSGMDSDLDSGSDLDLEPKEAIVDEETTNE